MVTRNKALISLELRRAGRVALALLLVLLIGLPAPLGAKSKKGEKLHKQGVAAESAQKWDEAMSFYEQALATDPADASYIMALRRVRFQAGMAHVNAGQKLRAQGKLEEALKEFEKASAIDPANPAVDTELKRTRQMIERNKKGEGGGSASSGAPGQEGVKPGDRGLTPQQLAQKAAEQRVEDLQAPPELRPLSHSPINLKMTNQPVKILYETVGKLAGINVVFDPEFAGGRGIPAGAGGGTGNYSIDLTNISLEAALDYLAVQTKTFWKPLAANTIFVTRDDIAKRRDYEDYVVKTFYLKNVTTVQELSEISTVLRALTEIRRLFQYNSMNAIVARGTVDQIALLEKLINDLDKPKSEVVVDVIVMEANKTKTRTLASTLTTQGSPGANVPVYFTPRNPVLFGNTSTAAAATTTTTTTGTAVTNPYTSAYGSLYGSSYGTGTSSSSTQAVSLAQLGHLSTNDFSLTLPGALLNMIMSDRTTKILQSPQIRAIDSVKATLRIGDKYPYATGSFNAGYGGGSGIGGIGGGISPLMSTQFQFAEVGVNVDLVAKIHSAEEVSFHIDLEVSSVRDKVTIGGLDQPVIGQRKFSHDVRLKEGEVALLGGLMQTQDTRTLSGVPGLATMPLLGRLFGNENTEKDRGELLIALVPHILRSPDLQPVNLRGVASGADQAIHVSYAQREEIAPKTPAGGGAVQAPGTAPAPLTPAPITPSPAAGGTTSPRIYFTPPAAQVATGSSVSLTLQVENATDLFTAPLTLRFDPRVVQVRDVTAGGFLGGDGQKINFSKNILNDSGQVTVTLNRMPNTGGVSGAGTLLTLQLQAVGSGLSQISVSGMGAKDSKLQPIAVTIPAAVVTVP
jgi:general secretion pathway protein D